MFKWSQALSFELPRVDKNWGDLSYKFRFHLNFEEYFFAPPNCNTFFRSIDFCDFLYVYFVTHLKTFLKLNSWFYCNWDQKIYVCIAGHKLTPTKSRLHHSSLVRHLFINAHLVSLWKQPNGRLYIRVSRSKCTFV